MIIVPIAVSLREVGAFVGACVVSGVLGYAFRGKEHAAIAEAAQFGQSVETKAVSGVQNVAKKL